MDKGEGETFVDIRRSSCFEGRSETGSYKDESSVGPVELDGVAPLIPPGCRPPARFLPVMLSALDMDGGSAPSPKMPMVALAAVDVAPGAVDGPGLPSVAPAASSPASGESVDDPAYLELSHEAELDIGTSGGVGGGD